MHRSIVALLLCLACCGHIWAQGAASFDCAPTALAQQQRTLAKFLELDFRGDAAGALANLFRLGATYQNMALECGYQPNDAEKEQLLERTLQIVSVEDMLAAQSVGDDVPAIMVELETVYGDPLQGQLLYNGLEPALGGIALGCGGCHENEAVAPLTQGSWTRVDELRLQLPQFAGYSHRQFFVESIVQPNAYITPEYAAMMPDFYGAQLSTQQLADLLAFLDSQDQLLEGA